MSQLCRDLGMAPYLDFCLTSEEVGVEKPDPAIFVAALDRAGVKPGEAVHVGDQPRSDLVGARGAGLHAVLLDRGGWHRDVDNCLHISGLTELDDLLQKAPASLQPGQEKGRKCPDTTPTSRLPSNTGPKD